MRATFRSLSLACAQATLHAFNDWDDQFSVTSAGGLDDRHASVNGSFGRVGLACRRCWASGWHDYHADRGGRCGSEWNASLAFPLPAGISGVLKVADHHADGYRHNDAKRRLQFERHIPDLIQK